MYINIYCVDIIKTFLFLHQDREYICELGKTIQTPSFFWVEFLFFKAKKKNFLELFFAVFMCETVESRKMAVFVGCRVTRS